ncbi:VaFE repeat-containing surface-anchored protein [Enterococcus faecalis]|uniref:VaFE repeat-containing surface-anchored protein n=1 Tax=Enterococcus faecalis TaxID=1351 RepID=UPI0025AF9E93|nr:VaFE repeat-containing surface-anchored protein [Enterococcus faecalis]MDN3126010.1 VaFE repeat-containing surface-anchored protein [Enterococcus faecalis]
MKDRLSKVKNKFLVLLAMLTIVGANVVPSTIAMAESLDNTEQVASLSEKEDKKISEESTESSSKDSEATTTESTQNTQTELDKTIGESMNSNDSPIDSTDSSSETTSTEATNTMEETQEKGERTGEELANRDNPMDVQGLTDNEIISLVKYMYGDYAKQDSSFGMSVKNDQGKSIEIPFERTTSNSRAIGAEGNPVYARYDASKGAWTAWGEFYQPLYIDGKLAYCVEPGVLFVPGAGFTQQTTFNGITSAQSEAINTVMNFGAKKGDSGEYIFATNMYIWEKLGWSVSTSLPGYANYKQQIENNIAKFRIKPSFHQKTYNVKVGETLKITDTNGVLNNFSIKNNLNAKVEKKGNVLEITPNANSTNGNLDLYRNTFYTGSQFFWVKPGSQSVTTGGSSDPTVAFVKINVIKNGKAKIKKVDDNGNPVAGAKFELKNLADGSKKTATTNKNGEFESVEYAADTQLEIREIEAPIGYLLDTSVKKVTIKAAQTTTVNFTNPKMTLKTTAADKEDNDKVLSPEKNVTIKDKVQYTNLYTDGREYVVKGKLMDKATNKPLLVNGKEVTSEKKFKPTSKDGFVEVSFTLDASALAGKTVVVFETLYQDNKEIVVHADINDVPQTVTFDNPKISTTAVNDENNGKEFDPEEKVVLKDTVAYEGLQPNKVYKLNGKLMDKATNKPLEINGEEVTSEVTFKPTKAKGTIDVTYEFDARELKGKELVVFEYLSRQRSDSKEWNDVVKHTDINDKGQTVKVNHPEIQTEAHFEEDGSKVSDPLAEVTIVDVVSFKNLIPGNTYELKGKLMDKATNKPLLIDGEEVTASKRFTPTTSEGSETIEFKVNAKDLQGKTVVVFENLYKNDTEIAIHADIEDEGQTVEFTEPKLKTTALDNDSNSHSAEALKEVTITDTVSYSDLLDGKVYNISGVVMDKKTNKPLLIDGKEVRNEVNFIARNGKAEIIEDKNDSTDSEQTNEIEKPVMRAAAVQINRVSGTVEVTFTMNAEQLKGKSVVIFETLTREDTEIAVHQDINDEGQTVTFTEPKLKTTAINQDSGDHKADALEKVTITDTVSYTDLIEGKTYELAGVLMDKATNKPLLVNGKEVRNSLKFIARNGKAEIVTTEAKMKTAEKQKSPLVSGTVDLSFELNAKDLQGKETVVFETVTRNDTEVAVHADINDKNQTIEFNKPTLKTTATINDGKLGVSGGQMTINDKVKYTNLTPGKTYTIKGKLMDKTTNKPFIVNGKEVEAVKTFVPKTANGEVIVPFTFDSQEITSEIHVVVFEDLYRDNLKLTTHADINDLAQTVRIVPPTKFLPKTGEQKGILFTILGFILLAGAAYLVTTKRKQNN